MLVYDHRKEEGLGFGVGGMGNGVRVEGRGVSSLLSRVWGLELKGCFWCRVYGLGFGVYSVWFTL